MPKSVKLHPGKRPPGYDPDKPILPYKANGKIFCPIPGCKHKGTTNQDGWIKHLKTDHSRCLDPNKVRMYGSNIVYDKECKVLVCLKHETVRLKNSNFCEDTEFTITGMRIETSHQKLECTRVEPLASELPEGLAIEGLTILSGYHCNLCGVVENNRHRCDSSTSLVKCEYQRIKHFKNGRSLLHRIGKTPSHSVREVPREDPPVYEERQYLHRHEFLWRQFNFENHPTIMRKIENDGSRVCQAMFELYFYQQYITLISDRFVGFRKTLSHDLHECEPFGTLSDKTAVIRYAEVFGKFGILLMRNRIFRVSYNVCPLGDEAANLMFDVFTRITQSLYTYNSIVKQIKSLKKRLPIVQNKINELDRRFASDAVDLTNLKVLTKSEILADANSQNDVVHKLMVNLLLEDGANNYTLLQACGYYLRYSQKEQLDGIQGPKFTSAIMFSMKLTCWAQLLRDHDLGYSLWMYSLESTQELGRRFYSLCHDVQVYADTSRRVSCTWVVHGETLAIEGKRLELDSVRSGLKNMIQDLQIELRQLVFDEKMDCIVPEDVTERSHGFSPFPRQDLLNIQIKDLPPNYIDMGQIFLMKLMVLVRLCCLGAPRQTEITMFTYRNTQIFRSIRLMEQVVRIRSDYHKNKYLKGRSISSKALTFLYVLPVSVSNLLVWYLVYVRPLELKLLRFQLYKSKQAFTGITDDIDLEDLPEFEYESDEEMDQNILYDCETDSEDELEFDDIRLLSNKTIHVPVIETEAEYKQKSKHGRMMQYYLCCSPTGFWPDYYLYRIHYTMTNKYFGTSLTFNNWRHVYELINIQFEKDEVASEIKSMLSKATGHTELTAAMNYGVDGERSMDVTVADTIKYEFLSELYHNFLGLNTKQTYFRRYREEDYVDIGGDLKPSSSDLLNVSVYDFFQEEMTVAALIYAGYSFIAVVDNCTRNIISATYDCRTISDTDLENLEFVCGAVVITNAHLILRKPEIVQILRKLSGVDFKLVLISPLIPNYMIENYKQVLGMELPYYRQKVYFDKTVFYKMYTTKLRLLYLFGHIVRKVDPADGMIVMYCAATARKFFNAIIPSTRSSLVVFLDANDESVATEKVQLVVHYGFELSYMHVMNQIHVQQATTSLWLGCFDDTIKDEIDTDHDVSRHYLKHDGCLRLFHQSHFRGVGMSCRDTTGNVTRHCSNCRKLSDQHWTSLTIPKGYDFDIKLWLLALKSECLCESNICSIDDQTWRDTVLVPHGHCPECGVCSTDVSGLLREDHATECHVKYILRDAIFLCFEQYSEDWEVVEGIMGDALRRRGVYRRAADHQWENYLTMKEKQVVVLAVEYLYQMFFYRKLNF